MGNIANLFRGNLIYIEFTESVTTWPRPPAGKIWLVLSGFVSHVTGTISQCAIGTLGATNTSKTLLCRVLAAVASGGFPIGYIETNTNFQLYFVDQTEQLTFSGDATAYVRLKILEFDA